MKRKVKEVANLAGISVRTLHYYDEIGLLSPTETTEAGYRLYSEKDLDLLQQILFFRELGFSLKDIKKIVQCPTFDREQALVAHRQLLVDKRQQIERMIATIDQTLQHIKGELEMMTEEKFQVFKENRLKENEEMYGEELRERYGDETIEASFLKWKKISLTDYNKMMVLEEEIFSLLKEACVIGDPSSNIAQELAGKHHQWLLYTWSTYSKEAHVGLAELYVTDERFTAYFDKRVPGGATFLRDAILVYVASNVNA